MLPTTEGSSLHREPRTVTSEARSGVLTGHQDEIGASCQPVLGSSSRLGVTSPAEDLSGTLGAESRAGKGVRRWSAAATHSSTRSVFDGECTVIGRNWPGCAGSTHRKKKPRLPVWERSEAAEPQPHRRGRAERSCVPTSRSWAAGSDAQAEGGSFTARGSVRSPGGRSVQSRRGNRDVRDFDRATNVERNVERKIDAGGCARIFGPSAHLQSERPRRGTETAGSIAKVCRHRAHLRSEPGRARARSSSRSRTGYLTAARPNASDRIRMEPVVSLHEVARQGGVARDSLQNVRSQVRRGSTQFGNPGGPP